MNNNKMRLTIKGVDGVARLVSDPNGELVPTQYAWLTDDEIRAIHAGIGALDHASGGHKRMKHRRVLMELLMR